jgi:hypothetical protein
MPVLEKFIPLLWFLWEIPGKLAGRVHPFHKADGFLGQVLGIRKKGNPVKIQKNTIVSVFFRVFLAE